MPDRLFDVECFGAEGVGATAELLPLKALPFEFDAACNRADTRFRGDPLHMSELHRFRADIQGLRAVAIVPVVAYHAMNGMVPGGFVGVDIFFVISGFLIAQILLRELDGGSFSILGFYERRVRRLFPALFAMLAFTLVAGWLLLPPADYKDLGRATIATVAFVSNLHFWLTLGYFDTAAELRPLLHTWSLAVEEQFYLAFPLFLFVVHRFARRHLAIILWGCAIASLTLSQYQLSVDPRGAFFLPFGRAFELLIGAILGVGAIGRIRSPRLLDLLSWVGLGMMLASFALFGNATPFPGIAALLPCIGAALILYCGIDRDSGAGRLLSHPLPVFLGGISYSLYLWHWPLLVYARFAALGEPGPFMKLGLILAAVLIAWASWRFVEQPFLQTRNRRRTFAAAGAMAAAPLLAAAFVYLGQGIPNRFNEQSQQLFAMSDDYSPRRAACHDDQEARTYADSCRLGTQGVPADTAVLGDSFGVELAMALGERAAKRGASVVEITASACPPALGYSAPRRIGCSARNRAAFEALSADPNIHTVVMVAAFPYRSDPRDAALMRGYARMAKGLHAAGKQLVLIAPIPQMPFSAPVALGMTAGRGGNLGGVGADAAQFERQSGFYSSAIAAVGAETAAQIIVPEKTMCAAGTCRAYREGVGALYFDKAHLSMAGARQLAAQITLTR